MALSQSFQDWITVMLILQESKSKGVKTISYSLKLYCKAFDDNSSALELSHTLKIWLQINKNNIVYHHFISYIIYKKISIFPINPFNKISDIVTKLLPQNDFLCHQNTLLKW